MQELWEKRDQEVWKETNQESLFDPKESRFDPKISFKEDIRHQKGWSQAEY